MILLFQIFITGIFSALLLYLSFAGGIKINNRFFKYPNGHNNRSDELVAGFLFFSAALVTGVWSWIIESGSLHNMFYGLSALFLFPGTLILTGMFIYFLVTRKSRDRDLKSAREFEDI